METPLQRRLAAILAADVVSYSARLGRDEAGTLERMRRLHADVLEPAIAARAGRVVKTTGDGILAEFPSAVAAVECAVAVQAANAALDADRRLELRIGVSIGEVVIEGGDVFGDGVNIAARLQALAPPGGALVTGDAWRQVRGKVAAGVEDEGTRQLHNIAEPVQVFRLVPPPAAPAAAGGPEAFRDQQDVRFCRAPDGLNLAYATVGAGPPLVKTANWMSHLEFDWQSPVWHPLYEALARRFRLVRYDQRGNGLSDREVGAISFAAFVADLETVVDAAGLERFALFGVSQGAAVSVAYAARHPERVSRLVLFGGYAQGWRRRGDAVEIERRGALHQLIRHGWGMPHAAFRQVFTSLYVPDATREQAEWWNELQRVSASPETAARILETLGEIDVTAELGRVRAPTLVLHSRDELAVPFDSGRALARGIAGARFVGLESRNHIILSQEKAWPRFVDELMGFLGAPE